MTRRGGWVSGFCVTVALIGGAVWTYQPRTPDVATSCSSCDARHQHLAAKRAAAAKPEAAPLTPYVEPGATE
jgi:hypothetical protein